MKREKSYSDGQMDQEQCASQSDETVKVTDPLNNTTASGKDGLMVPGLQVRSMSIDEVALRNGAMSATEAMTSPSRVPMTQSSHNIRFTEMAPSNGHLMDEGESEDFWRMSLQKFTSKRRGHNAADRGLPRRVKSYYKQQDDLIKVYEESMNLDADSNRLVEETKRLRSANLLSKISLFVNLFLLIIKLVASIMSGSLVVISSLVDSCVDLMSGVVIWWTTRAVKKRNIYVYPGGRTRLEPVAIVILSVIMSVASVQLVAQSVESLINLASLPGNEGAPSMGIVPVVFLGVTIVSKLILFILCRLYRTPLTEVLAQDHRNDVLSNAVALACGLLAFHYWKYLDPIGAILMSIYIFISWWLTGSKQIRNLTGYTAKPQLLKKLTWICLNHHKDILYIDTVRAFHFGTNFIVEVDIVLPENMSLKEAHNIGEPLQQKLEKLPCVERAFVHLDYEFQHNPNTEHKVL